MTLMQVLAFKPRIMWMEPSRFRAACLGQRLRIGWPSHLAFVVVAAGSLLVDLVAGKPDPWSVANLLAAVGTGAIVAYLLLIVQRYQPYPAYLTARGVVFYRAKPMGMLPLGGLYRLPYEKLGRCVIGPISCQGGDFEALLVWYEPEEKWFKIGLSRQVKKADLVDWFEKHGVKVEVLETPFEV